MFRSVVTLVASMAALVVFTSSAAAAPAWRDVTGNTHTSLTVMSMARDGATGPLRVVWAAPGTNINSSNVLYTRDVLASGALGPVRTVLTDTGAGAFNNPAIARNPIDGSFWLFGSASDIVEGRLFAMQSIDGGVTWSPNTPISTSTSAYASFGHSAAFAADGSAYQTFMGTFKRTLGVDAAEDDLGNAPGIDAGNANGCCVYWSQVAIDSATGTPYVGWFSNLRTGRYGVEVVNTATGAVSYAPGSADAIRGSSTNGNQPTPLTGRIGAGGVYVGYCSGYPYCKAAMVWKHGAPTAMKVGVGSDIEAVRIAAAPGGRLWVYWVEGKTLYARRSNPAATSWGAMVSRKLPAAQLTYWQVAGEGSAGFLDAFVGFGSNGVDSTWTTRLTAGLTVANAKSVKKGMKLTVKVTDAGVAVPGVKVKLRGKFAMTNAAGVAKVLATGSAGSAVVTATRAGFTTGTRGVKITS